MPPPHVSYQQCLLEREFADGGFHCVITLGRQMLGTNAKSLSGQTSILSLSCIKNVLYKDKGMFHVFVAKSWGDGGFFFNSTFRSNQNWLCFYSDSKIPEPCQNKLLSLNYLRFILFLKSLYVLY